MKAIKFAVLALCFALPLRPAQAQQYSGELKVYDSTGHLKADQSQTITADFSALNWLPPGNYGASITGLPLVIPAPTPAPSPSPSGPSYGVTAPAASPVVLPPSAPPTAVNDCPNLVLNEDFTEGQAAWNAKLSPDPGWGPLTNGVMYAAHKADGTDFGGGTNIADDFQPSQVHSDGSNPYYDVSKGFLQLNCNVWSNHGGPSASNGDGRWKSPMITSYSYHNESAPSGESFTPPFYAEFTCQVPALGSSDVPYSAGLWPSITFYTIPSSPGPTRPSDEIDVFEMYSRLTNAAGGLTNIQCSTHLYNSDGSNGGYTNGGYASGLDLSHSWHTYGLWVDTTTTHWYLDGVEIYSAPTPTNGANPAFYFQFGPVMGGGWPVCLNLANQYVMYVSGWKIWSH